MNEFNWIVDENLKDLAERDYRDFLAEYQSNHFKSTIILAGSLVERLLLYVLMEREAEAMEAYSLIQNAGRNTDGKSGGRNNSDILRFDLGTIVTVAKKLKLVSHEVEKLSEVVREYRNIVHPGNELRRKYEPNKKRAEMAHALVEMIVEVFKSGASERLIWDNMPSGWIFDKANPSSKIGFSRGDAAKDDGSRSVIISGLSRGIRGEPCINVYGHFSSRDVKRNLEFDMLVDRRHCPDEIMVQLMVEGPRCWEHRVFWGKDLIEYGISGEASRRPKGRIPNPGEWYHAKIDLSKDLGISSKNKITGIGWTLSSKQAGKKLKVQFARTVFT